MKQDTIDKILQLADKAFVANEPADKFARLAAHEAAHAAAEKHSTECADSAALIAATEFYASVSDATTFSSRVTDAANDCTALQRRYEAERASYEDARVVPQRITAVPYQVVTRPANQIAHQTSSYLTSSYLSTFSHQPEANHKAKHAARYVYRHTYCAVRSAYVIACFDANSAQDITRRGDIFKSTMQNRLNQDLKYDLIEPSFFLQMMCSLTVQIIAGILLAGGVLVIFLGAFAVASLPVVETVVIGTAVAAIGASGLIGSFFAQNELARIEKANEHCEALNQIS